MGNHTLEVRFEKDLKSDDGESLVGQCLHQSAKGHIAIAIDPECSGIGLFDVACHEAAHAAEYVFGLDVSHQTVYTIAVGLSQFLISTGLVLPEEFEARLRRLMLEAK